MAAILSRPLCANIIIVPTDVLMTILDTRFIFASYVFNAADTLTSGQVSFTVMLLSDQLHSIHYMNEVSSMAQCHKYETLLTHWTYFSEASNHWTVHL